ncbi:MAG: class I SAM-dependent methyltransferase [Anaerolineae bacterium]|nr:class I SAM-dependent methyltransferase [Anaerolineae bacterium]
MNADERTSDWYEQDSLWEGTAQIIFSREALENAPQQVAQVLSLADLEPPLRVLDMPCGVGRHTLEFVRLGCAVTGVDRTAFYLKEARATVQAAEGEVEWIEADMRAFQQPGAFDLAINLFTSFGYFEDRNDDLKVLDNFYTSLRPGGVLVMDMMGKEIVARIFIPRDWDTLDDGTLLLRERSIHQDWTWIENCWILITNGNQRKFALAHRLYGASDLKNILVQAGFTGIRIYGSLSGTPYDQTAQRLVAVAHKSESAG